LRRTTSYGVLSAKIGPTSASVDFFEEMRKK